MGLKWLVGAFTFFVQLLLKYKTKMYKKVYVKANGSNWKQIEQKNKKRKKRKSQRARHNLADYIFRNNDF